jgi:hypothetical protein
MNYDEGIVIVDVFDLEDHIVEVDRNTRGAGRTFKNDLVIIIIYLFCFSDYEGYDDVYGHSLDDDYGVSPSGKSFGMVF